MNGTFETKATDNVPVSRKGLFRSFREKKIGGVLRILRALNICNGLLLLLIYPMGFLANMISFDITFYFFSFYCICFALLLICFEINLTACRQKLRKNFGFMFSFLGRTVFLLFTASISVASGWTWGYILGGLTVCNALFNTIVLWQHPAFHSGGRFSWMSDPTQKYTSATSEGKMFMKSNPNLTSKAFSGGVAIAAANPEFAMSIAKTAAKQSTEDFYNDNSDPLDEPAGLPDVPGDDPFA